MPDARGYHYFGTLSALFRYAVNPRLLVLSQTRSGTRALAGPLPEDRCPSADFSKSKSSKKSQLTADADIRSEKERLT